MSIGGEPKDIFSGGMCGFVHRGRTEGRFSMVMCDFVHWHLSKKMYYLVPYELLLLMVSHVVTRFSDKLILL